MTLFAAVEAFAGDTVPFPEAVEKFPLVHSLVRNILARRKVALVPSELSEHELTAHRALIIMSKRSPYARPF